MVGDIFKKEKYFQNMLKNFVQTIKKFLYRLEGYFFLR